LLLTDDKYLDKGFSKLNRRVLVIEQNRHGCLAVVKLNSLQGKEKKVSEGRLLPLGKNKGTDFGVDVNLYTEQSDHSPIKVGHEFRPSPWHLRKNKRTLVKKHIYSNILNKGISKNNRRKKKHFLSK
jgi:hypothetical protein